MNVSESTAGAGSRELVSGAGGKNSPPPGEEVVVYTSPEVAKLSAMVAAARGRLAELEATYTSEKARVDSLQAALFRRLRPHYERRDRFRLIVTYRLAYLKNLQQGDKPGAAWIAEEFKRACARSEEEYRQTETTMAGKRELTVEEESEVVWLWKKLVKLYHPDLVATDPQKRETYEKLSREINLARDNGDLQMLRLIADDPDAFMLRHGWALLDFADGQEASRLRRLWENLEAEIVTILETTTRMKESSEYELYRLTSRAPELFEETVAKRTEAIEEEIARLQFRGDELAKQISELSSDPVAIR